MCEGRRRKRTKESTGVGGREKERGKYVKRQKAKSREKGGQGNESQINKHWLFRLAVEETPYHRPPSWETVITYWPLSCEFLK